MATKHFQVRGHAVMRSLEPGEIWARCYIDELMIELPAYPVAARS